MSSNRIFPESTDGLGKVGADYSFSLVPPFDDLMIFARKVPCMAEDLLDLLDLQEASNKGHLGKGGGLLGKLIGAKVTGSPSKEPLLDALAPSDNASKVQTAGAAASKAALATGTKELGSMAAKGAQAATKGESLGVKQGASAAECVRLLATCGRLGPHKNR
jgi:hypothetical protein